MGRWVGLAWIGLGVLLAAPVHAESPFHGNAQALLGGKRLADSDFDNLRDQGLIGVMFDVRAAGWPVNIAFDALLSASGEDEDGVERGVATVEYGLGLRKDFSFGASPFHPFVGAGINQITAGISVDDGFNEEDDSDSAIGYYATAGAFYTFGEHINLGLVYRHSRAEVELFDQDYRVGGDHLAGLLGYRW